MHASQTRLAERNVPEATPGLMKDSDERPDQMRDTERNSDPVGHPTRSDLPSNLG
jgi:hypothetical protein